MGIYATATLAYGYPLPEEETLPNLTDEQWEQAQEAWTTQELQKQGYEIIAHGNTQQGYNNYFIAQPGTQTRTTQFETTQITPQDLDTPPDQTKFRYTLTNLGLNPNKAAWHIMVNWG